MYIIILIVDYSSNCRLQLFDYTAWSPENSGFQDFTRLHYLLHLRPRAPLKPNCQSLHLGILDEGTFVIDVGSIPRKGNAIQLDSTGEIHL